MDDESGLKVGDVMTRGVIGVDIDDTVQKAAEVMDKNKISAVIVLKKSDAAGIVTERDITSKVVAQSKDPRKISVSEIMTSPLITINPDDDLDDAARLMRDSDIRRLVVTSNDKIIGVLSEFDIVRVEPALHLLIRERSKWELSEAHAASQGAVSGICETCENYSENLHSVDGRILCGECLE